MLQRHTGVCEEAFDVNSKIAQKMQNIWNFIVESTRNGKLRRLSGRFQTLIWRPGETVQKLESPRLSGRVDSPENYTETRWETFTLRAEVTFSKCELSAKSSLCWQPFNFLSCMCEIRHAIRKQNYSSAGLSSNGTSFAGIKKIATTLIFCYARLTQCSKLVKSRKNSFFLIYSSRFLDGFEWLSAEATFHTTGSHSENVASARKVGNISLVS